MNGVLWIQEKGGSKEKSRSNQHVAITNTIRILVVPGACWIYAYKLSPGVPVERSPMPQSTPVHAPRGPKIDPSGPPQRQSTPRGLTSTHSRLLECPSRPPEAQNRSPADPQSAPVDPQRPKIDPQRPPRAPQSTPRGPKSPKHYACAAK